MGKKGLTGLVSMTGFGRAEVPLAPAGRAVVEIHTLNHRFLEVECRLPEGLQGFEESIRTMVTRALHRGRVKVSVSFKARTPRPTVSFEASVARQYVTLLRRLKRKLKVPGEVTLETVLGLPQVMISAERGPEPTQGFASIRRGVSKALGKAVQMRTQEGRRLGGVLSRLVNQLDSLRKRIHRRLPRVRGAVQRRLIARIQSIARTLDRNAVAAEAASLVQSTDVSEEMARMDSHIAALRQTLAGRTESPGRTIDFLAQELHREVNTLGAKVRDGAILRWVVAMKNQIEKLREQAANIE